MFRYTIDKAFSPTIVPLEEESMANGSLSSRKRIVSKFKHYCVQIIGDRVDAVLNDLLQRLAFSSPRILRAAACSNGWQQGRFDYLVNRTSNGLLKTVDELTLRRKDFCRRVHARLVTATAVWSRASGLRGREAYRRASRRRQPGNAAPRQVLPVHLLLEGFCP